MNTEHDIAHPRPAPLATHSALSLSLLCCHDVDLRLLASLTNIGVTHTLLPFLPAKVLACVVGDEGRPTGPVRF